MNPENSATAKSYRTLALGYRLSKNLILAVELQNFPIFLYLKM